jgi:hypothetical protein
VTAGGDELGEARRGVRNGLRCGDAENVEAFGLGIGDKAGLQPPQIVRRQKSRLV